LRVALRIVGWILTLLIVVVGGAAWWLLIRPLPQVDGTAALPGLQNAVTVERDGGEFRMCARDQWRTWPKGRGT